MTRRRFGLLAGLLAIAAALVAVAVVSPWGDSRPKRNADLESALDLASQPPEMVAMYHYAEGHRALFEQVPCYCGCGKAIGHQSLLDCFLIAAGKYSDHASGCMVCTDEAADVERLVAEGQDARAIRAWIDVEYSKYGPPTNTP